MLSIFYSRPTIDVWSVIAGLFNVLKEVDISHVKLYNCKKEGELFI